MKTIPIRVYFEDTDSGGVVYYANYLKFAERGRSEYLREYGIKQKQLELDEGVIFAVKSLVADYLLPALFDDLLIVETKIEKINPASIIFLQKIMNLEKNKVLFKTQVHVACIKVDNYKPCAIPKVFLEKINGY